jgi:signal transduction histidine kinase
LSAAPAGRDVVLRVVDTGIGIQAEHLGTLFQPFRQLESGLERQHEGTGLGLAICRRLAELLGGWIGVTSAWGRGSEFSVHLPLSAGEESSHAAHDSVDRRQ